MANNKIYSKTKFAVIVFLIVAILATALTAVLNFGKSNEGYRTITVIEIQGTVGVVHDNIEYAAYTGMHLQEGYSVVTGGNSYIRLLLDDDKYVKLESGAKATFEEVHGGKTAIKIERGSLLAEVTRPLEIDEDFIVNTPNAVLAVRGTLFRVDLSRNGKGELNTDVMTYGGAVSSKRIQPNGVVEDVEVAINEGFKATVNMDDKETVYLVDEVKVDLSALGGITTPETNENGEIIENTPVMLESVLMPIVIEDIPDDDLVDIYFASENGHSMFVETKEIQQQIEDRNIDITQKTSVYDVAEKIQKTSDVVVPDDNKPLLITTEEETEQALAVQGTPNDGVGEVVTESTTEAVTTEPTTAVSTTVATTVSTTVPTTTPTTTVPTTIPTTEPTTSHTHTEVTVEIKATCVEAGKVIVKCAECGEKLSEKVIEKLGHTAKTTKVAPTCTEVGSETTVCTVCEETLHYQVIDKLGHTEETIITDPTCTTDGSKVTKCTICEETLGTTVLKATGHTEANGGTDAVHTKCSLCDLPLVTEHEMDNGTVTKESTCVSQGEILYACTCGYSYSESLKLAEHTEVSGGTKDAHTKCGVCQTALNMNHDDQLKETVQQKEDCVNDGLYTYTCSCGYSFNNTIPKLGHTEIAAGLPDVHTKCSTCGEVVLDGTGHNYTESVTKQNTCTTEGLLTRTCDCGWSYTEYLASGHKKSDDGTTCVNGCGGLWVDLNDETFPDSMFLAYISSTYDSDANNALVGDEVTGVVTINVSGSSAIDGGYKDLTGINKFVNLTTVNCAYNSEIESLDLSGLSNLTSLDITGLVNLKKLDVSGCSKLATITGFDNCDLLEELNISGTKITDLKISNYAQLKSLDISETSITTLDANSNTKLEFVNLSNSSITSFVMGDDSIGNYALRSINLTGCSKLETLEINSAMYLEEIDLTDAMAIKTIDFGGCQYLTGSLNLSNKTNLTTVTMGATRINSLKVTGCNALVDLNISATSTLSTIQGLNTCTALEILDLGGTSLQSLDLSYNQNLGRLNVPNCKSLVYLDLTRSTESTTFNSLNITNCTSLKTLNLYNCKGITTLDTSTLTSLEELNLIYSGVTKFNGNQEVMDFSSNAKLKNVYLNGITSFASFDVSGNTALEEFSLTENSKVSTLDFSACTNLKKLTLSDVTSLTTLNIDNCTALESLNVLNTGVNSLSVTGSGALTQVYVYNNNSLATLNITGASALTDVKLSAGTTNTSLKNLAITNGGLTSIDVTYLKGLTTIDLSNTSITTLDVSACTGIASVNVTGNNMTSGAVTLPTGKDESIITGLV